MSEREALEHDFYLRALQVRFNSMTAREKRRLWRKQRLLYIAIYRLTRYDKETER